MHLRKREVPSAINHGPTLLQATNASAGKSEAWQSCVIQIPTEHLLVCSHRPGTWQSPDGDSRRQEPTAAQMGTLSCRREKGSPWGEAEGGAAGGERRRSSALWLFFDLRSAFTALIFLGRPRFRPAIFLPFLFSFFFRALEGDGFLTVATPDFSSSAPESWRTQTGSEEPQQKSLQGHTSGHPVWQAYAENGISPQAPRWQLPCSLRPWWE